MATAISSDGGKLIAFSHCPRGMPADAIPYPRLDPGASCSALEGVPPSVVRLDTRIGDPQFRTHSASLPRALTAGPRQPIGAATMLAWSLPDVASGTHGWYHALGRQAKLFRFYRGYLNPWPPPVGCGRDHRGRLGLRRGTRRTSDEKQNKG